MRHPAWISRVRARARDNRGVAMIEAAIFTPVFFAMIFGIMEIGLAMNDSLALANSVKAGSRMASATGNEPKADLYTLLNIARESGAIKRGDIKRIVIYRPKKFGDPPSDQCKAGVPQAWKKGDPLGADACNVYYAQDLKNAEIQVTAETAALANGTSVDKSDIFFGCKKGAPPNQDLLVDNAWCPTERKVTQPLGGPDYVGVWMRIEHRWVTKMFGNARTFEEQSIIRLEPRSS